MSGRRGRARNVSIPRHFLRYLTDTPRYTIYCNTSTPTRRIQNSRGSYATENRRVVRTVCGVRRTPVTSPRLRDVIISSREGFYKSFTAGRFFVHSVCPPHARGKTATVAAVANIVRFITRPRRAHVTKIGWVRYFWRDRDDRFYNIFSDNITIKCFTAYLFHDIILREIVIYLVCS